MADALSDAAFKVVVEEAPDAILLVDREGRIAYVNAEAEQRFGYSRDDLVGQRVEVLVPDERRTTHAVDREVYQERPEKRPMGTGLDLSGRRRDGSTFPVEISLSPFREGSPPLTVAVVRDVTRQRRAEVALRRSEERHRLLNERAENIIFRYRLVPSPRFEYVSAAVSAQLGYAPEELYIDERLLHRVAHDDDRHVIEQALSDTVPQTVSLRLLRRDGEPRWFELSIAVVRSAGGEAVALEGIARDVTERRIADEERLLLQAEVEMQLERNRIVGDLHDDTVQSLYALGLGLHAARGDGQMTREQLADHAIAGLSATIEVLRTHMHRLSGDGTDDEQPEPLQSRLQALVTDGATPAWEVRVDSRLQLDPPLQRELYMLAKELVSNVQRHAGATQASLSLESDGDNGVQLIVRDNGTGFARDAVPAGSFGLRSVELRASTIGGRLEIDAAPGAGSCIRLHIPPGAGFATIDRAEAGRVDGDIRLGGARLAT